MGRKLLAMVPTALPAAANLQRFHADAVDDPLFTVVTWSSRTSSSPNNSDVRTRQLALDRSTRQLLELQRLQAPEDSRSWFLGNDVHQDGSITVFSPMEPLFVLLDAAWPQRSRFLSMYDLLSQSHNTWLLQLQSLTQERIELVCDVQPTGGDESVDNLYVKASEPKILAWLRGKVCDFGSSGVPFAGRLSLTCAEWMQVERIAAVLAKQTAQAAAKASGSGAFDERFRLPGQKPAEVKPTTASTTIEETARHHREAIDVLCNYLPQEWVELLYKEFKYVLHSYRHSLRHHHDSRTFLHVDRVEKLVEAKAAASSGSRPPDSFKRFDRRQQTPESASKRPTPGSAGSAKKKSKLANVDRTGMKSLTSFFGKK
ncbi:hypothetical protein BBJ28_00020291 [Nothophytophthora sp. Chile5]|nr:hypothetical protein BBJ28_00020291 [Nothophytophthora sp. Chile5]